MAIRPSGREEMIAANRARARGNQNRVSPSKVANKTPEQASDAQDTKTNTNDGPTAFRYPLKALDEHTDMLLIRIFSYKGDPSQAFGIDDFLKDGKINPIPTTTSKFNDREGKYGSKKFMKDARYIWLPIPQQVTDSLSVGYAEDTLNPLQAAGLSLTKTAMDLSVGTDEQRKQSVEKLKSIRDDAFQAISNSANGRTLDLMKTALSATAINQFGANVNPTSLVTRASGQILQSNLELLFSNVTLRSFPFTFDFTPRDDREAQEVKAIIRTMKRAMVPKRGDGVFINSPDLFQFEYVTGAEREHPFLNRFKVGVLTDLSVNYTASGTYATYYDRTPVHIRLSCTLKEINPVYAEDYDDIGIGPNYGVGY